MGATPFLLGPLLVLLVFTVVASGNAQSIQGEGTRVGVCDPQNCVGRSGGNTYTCQTTDTNFIAGLKSPLLGQWNKCQISSTCLDPLPLGASCPDYLHRTLQGIPAGTYIPVGSAIFVPIAEITQVQSTTSNVFIFGSITNSGFVVMVLVAVGLVALAGLNIFGSGESPESIHILFMAGMLLGLWMILSAMEGVLVGSTASGFIQIDQVTPGLGTGLYVFMSLIFTFGAIQSISRGA